jgi:hypothetical protein
MDDAGAPLMARGAAMLRAALALSMTLLLAAHVGSPDVYFSGVAGPYPVDVVIRPPQVVPGLAEVLVRTADPVVDRVVIRPVYWRAGEKGAPAGDVARPVRGAPDTYTGQLWLMAAGPYSVHVTLTGARGSGTAVIPVAAVATGQLALSTRLRWLLATLGILLLAGVATAIHAAVGESQVEPGEEIPPQRRRRARIVTLASLPLLALVVLGGARWWTAEARAYRRTLDRPLSTHAAVRDSAGAPMLVLQVLDSAWRMGARSPVMPDHGKLAHLFLARVDSLDGFAHLHPLMPDANTFATPLPPLPAGRYRVFADIVHENGMQRTLVDSFTLDRSLATATAASLDRDDAWFDGHAVPIAPSAAATLGDGATIEWAGRALPVAGQVGVLSFTLADADGRPLVVAPYLGMLGHAVVMRRDGRVFIHLHPSGTSSMASELAFAIRNRGDTTADGRLDLRHAMPMDSTAASQRLDSIAFPYAFPDAGAYRVWVQLRLRGEVRTVAFDFDVAPDTTGSRRGK